MRIKTLLTVGAIAAFSFTALADDGHDNNNNNNNNNNNGSFQSSVIGSVTGLTIGGVGSGGAPWVVKQGEASVSSDGRIHVEVQGLLIGAGASDPTLVGTTATVTMVGATLVCGGSGGALVALPVAGVTPSPLSSLGNAVIDQTTMLPAACFGPVVLVQIFNPAAAQLGPFIAATGLAPNAAQNQNQNQNNNNHGDGDHGH